MELLLGIVALVVLGTFWRQALKGGAIIAGVTIGGSLILVFVLTVIWVGRLTWNFAAEAIAKSEKQHVEVAAASPAPLPPPGFNPLTDVAVAPPPAPTAGAKFDPFTAAGLGYAESSTSAPAGTPAVPGAPAAGAKFDPFAAAGWGYADGPAAAAPAPAADQTSLRPGLGAPAVDRRGVPIAGASVTYAEFRRRGCHIDLSKTGTIGQQEFLARDWAGQEGKLFGVATVLDARDLRFFICSPVK
jgi:hypothetical protein